MPGLSAEKLLEALRQNPELARVFSAASELETKANRHHIVPSSLTVHSAASSTGSITDVTTYRDGNALRVVEDTAGTYLDVSFYFNNVSSFQSIFLSAKYVGSSSHWMNVTIYDRMAGAYRTLAVLQHAGSVSDANATDIDTKVIQIPPSAVVKYISETRQVDLRLTHGTSGTANHDLWVDYVALVV